MFKLPRFLDRQRRLAEESDFGRRFGWFIEREGGRIRELEQCLAGGFLLRYPRIVRAVAVTRNDFGYCA
jgi:hypothetical protein